MKTIIGVCLLLCLLVTVKSEGGTDVVMSILSQFLSQSSPNVRATTPSGILPKVLNPLNWIPKIPEVPWNPDSELTTPEIIVRHGYQAETHTVQTEDGYLLNMHRIPCGRAGCSDEIRQPVFLQHGILASSADWILSGPEKGIGFILADLGYDVWLSNLRGNTYSRHHTQMSNTDNEFWDFSFHEMAIFDIPAEIDYIYEHRKRIMGEGVLSNDLIYVGHSMGTSALFVMLSELPEYNERIKLFIALAPVAFMSHVKSPLRFLAPFSKDIELDFLVKKLKIPENWHSSLRRVDGMTNEFLKKFSLKFLKIMKFFGQNEFLPQNKIIKWLSKYGCEMNEVENPAGTSTKTVVHYAQEIQESGNFQNFDYGKEENERRYGSEHPTQYNLSNVNVPIALFYAQNDWLAGYQDVKKLYTNLHSAIIIKEYSLKMSEKPPKKTLLQKYEIPVEFLDFDYLKTCTEAKTVEKIVKILRSGEEGYYPDLQKFAEDKLKELKPNSKVFRVEEPAVKIQTPMRKKRN
ncbi:hypothetical protein PVAND_000983 [Polypedilum vanderplanki]|uniref:Partial AB-hydrolase lipase domain-containing protein n=1 Tax=Polypedilum vanderplanki TaxID=319348 RepID=A0A9J6BLW4_POLVA|nr:hypothetical protein PVAND_000983 [Polypedilum vanderplanki]